MSLFQCEHCGCCENTALSCQGFDDWFQEDFDWSEHPDRKGLTLCSACGPSKYKDGSPSGFGEWHGEFERVYLPKGEFKTNRVGNLEHIKTGSENFRKYAIQI